MHGEFSGSFPDCTLSLFTNLKLMSAFYSSNAFRLQIGDI